MAVTGVTGKAVTGLDTTTPAILKKQAEAGQKSAEVGAGLITKGLTPTIGNAESFKAAKKSVLGDSPSVISSVNKATLGVQKDLQALAPKSEPKTVANAPVEPKKAVTDFANLGAQIGKKAETAFTSPLSRTEKADKPAATAPKGEKPQAAAPTQPPKADKPAATAPKGEKPIAPPPPPPKAEKPIAPPPAIKADKPAAPPPVKAEKPIAPPPAIKADKPAAPPPVKAEKPIAPPPPPPKPVEPALGKPDIGQKTAISNAIAKKGDAAPASPLSAPPPALKLKDAVKDGGKESSKIVAPKVDNPADTQKKINSGATAALSTGSAAKAQEDIKAAATSIVAKSATAKPASIQTDVKKDL